MDDDHGTGLTRRSFATGLGTLALAGLAGCSDALAGDPTPTDAPYDDLRSRQLWIASSLDVTVPSALSTVSSPDDADVIVLPDDTSRDASTIVDWLAAGTYVAWVGTDAQDAYLTLLDTDPYDTAFDQPRARGEATGEHLPDVVTAWAVPGEDRTTTQRATYAGTNELSAEQLFDAVDDAFQDDWP